MIRNATCSGMPSTLVGLTDRSVFNRRRRQLAVHIERLRQRLLNDLAPSEDTYFVDSMPLEVCKLGRAKRLSICQEAEGTRPDYGYCAVHKAHYFGYKPHAVCTPKASSKHSIFQRHPRTTSTNSTTSRHSCTSVF